MALSVVGRSSVPAPQALSVNETMPAINARRVFIDWVRAINGHYLAIYKGALARTFNLAARNYPIWSEGLRLVQNLHFSLVRCVAATVYRGLMRASRLFNHIKRCTNDTLQYALEILS